MSVAKYRAQLLEPAAKSAKGEGFDVMKSGGQSTQSIVYAPWLNTNQGLRRPRVLDWFPIGR